jgi:hypothetical protein
MAKPENQFLDLYFVQDVIRGPGVEHGHVYQPDSAPHNVHYDNIFKQDEHGPGTQRLRLLDKDNVGTHAEIWNNEEIMHFHPEYTRVVIKGTDDNDCKASYIKSIGDFVQAFPSAYVFPWAISTGQIYSQKYYIMEGFGKLKDDKHNPQYALCNGEFLNWLFIDDGAGNITNIDGVAFRYEVLRSSHFGFYYDIFTHGQQITDTIINPPYVWTTTSMDYIYGPQSSAETNKKFHVYTGDLLLKKPSC